MSVCLILFFFFLNCTNNQFTKQLPLTHSRLKAFEGLFCSVGNSALTLPIANVLHTVMVKHYPVPVHIILTEEKLAEQHSC